MGKPDVGRIFLNDCVDIVEVGRFGGIEVTKIDIEGVYMGEIFRFTYDPLEEGYGTEEEENKS